MEIRNVCLVAHGGAGKTTLAEAILYCAGVKDRRGSVEAGTTASDWDSEEIKRQISIGSAVLSFTYKERALNLIDAPGYADFVAEIRAAMRVTDTAVLVISAVDGVEVGTERAWRNATDSNMQRVLFINKLDRERADFKGTLAQLQEAFGRVVPLQLPIGAEAQFAAIIDLVKLRALRFDEKGRATEGPIPPDLKASAEAARLQLLEAAVEGDEALLEKYLADKPISDAELLGALGKSIKSGALLPVLCGSASKNIGVSALLDFLVEAGRSPLERAPMEGQTSDGQPASRPPRLDAPFSARIFKIVVDPYVGKLSFFRVWSGSVTTGSTVLNPTNGKSIKLGHLYKVLGKEQRDVVKLEVGEIGAISKVEDAAVGDMLTDPAAPIIFTRVEFPRPVMALAIRAKTKGDEDKLSTALKKLLDEDPTLKREYNDETKELLLWGMGNVHLEIAMGRLQSRYGVGVEASLPKIPYRETVKGRAEAQGKHKKQTGGRGQYGDCWLRVEPKLDGEYEFVDAVVGGVIPSKFIPSVEKGVIAARQEGVLAGYRVVGIKVTVYDGSYHDVDSSDIAFQLAGRLGFRNAFEKARPTILEPIMRLKVTVPDSYTGDIIGDITSRRGRVLEMQPDGRLNTILATVPQAEILEYSPTLRSITGGRGVYSVKFERYEEAPPEIVQRVVAQAQARREAG